jgi:hypothetical protein
MKILKWFAVAAGVVAICLASGAPVFADAAGSLNVANCSGGGVTLGATSITWLPSGTVLGTGCIATGAGTNLTYLGGLLGPGVTGNIQNVTSGVPIDQFMTFPGTSLDFVLTFLGPGSSNTDCSSLTLGQSCSIAAGSPFVLTDLGSSTIVGFSAGGTVADGGGISNWSGAFSTQVNETALQIQSTILGGGTVTSTQSAQFSVQSVPEPSSLLLLAFGLCSSAGLIRRKRLA